MFGNQFGGFGQQGAAFMGSRVGGLMPIQGGRPGQMQGQFQGFPQGGVQGQGFNGFGGGNGFGARNQNMGFGGSIANVAMAGSVSNNQFMGGRQGLYGSVGGMQGNQFGQGFNQNPLLSNQMTNSIGRPYQLGQQGLTGSIGGFGRQNGYSQPFGGQQGQYGGGYAQANGQQNMAGFGALQNSISLLPNGYNSPYKQGQFGQNLPIFNPQMQRGYGNQFQQQPQSMYGMLTASRERGVPRQPQNMSPYRQPYYPGMNGPEQSYQSVSPFGQVENSISMLPNQNQNRPQPNQYHPYPPYQQPNQQGKRNKTEAKEDFSGYNQSPFGNQFGGDPWGMPSNFQNFPPPQQFQEHSFGMQGGSVPPNANGYRGNPQQIPKQGGKDDRFCFSDPNLNKMYQEFKASNEFKHIQHEQPPPYYGGGPPSGMKGGLIPSIGGNPFGGGEEPWLLQFGGKKPNPPMNQVNQKTQQAPPKSFQPENQFNSTKSPLNPPKETPPSYETPQKTIQTLDAYQQLCNQYASANE